MKTRVSSASREVLIGHGLPTVLIGERINPAGRKKLSEELRAGNLDMVCREALAQTQAGADIIDICVNAFGVEEVSLLPRAVQAAMDIVDVPLCLDSSNPEALKEALKVYKGKPLVNSVTADARSLLEILPLVKEYGAAVIGLAQDSEGIPKNSDKRFSVARKIVERAEGIGIPREDIIIDCLALAVGVDTSSALVALETIQKVKAELGVNLTLGASNISFGLPDRSLLNNAFVAIAIAAGVTCLIVDVAKVRPMVLAADLIMNRDSRARRYIESYRQRQKQ